MRSCEEESINKFFIPFAEHEERVFTYSAIIITC